MEKEGLSRALLFLADNSVQVGMLVTDRHKQINKFLNKKYPQIEHHYDVWHASKGKFINEEITNILVIILLKKKLTKLSQYKDCNIVGD